MAEDIPTKFEAKDITFKSMNESEASKEFVEDGYNDYQKRSMRYGPNLSKDSIWATSPANMFVAYYRDTPVGVIGFSTYKKALLGERIETPEFILQNSMQIDYTYYITNQLMNPLQQMFGLALEKIFVYKNTQPKTIRDYRMTIEKLDHEHKNDLETFMKKREKYCSTHVKQMLFDPFLTEIYNKQNGVQTLFQFYKKKK